ncbi:NAD-dependent epimerase/dehydratase family protein [Ancylobacter sp.]|uniref:NAD-dependent epimerase/dehydratase family protein n=1 Tax=Ancylobacter sp. TaxID=1872567 RepID=UPI003D13B681
MEKARVALTTTGSGGFIARGVLETCAREGLGSRALSRGARPNWVPDAIAWVTLPSYADQPRLASALAGTRFVLHLADDPARHGERDPAEALRVCDALIEAAREAKVEAIILASSVYARDARTPYGSSKRAIEDRLLAASDVRTIVLRLPPVYGPGCKGGFAALAKLVGKGLPLPLGAARAPRAYLSRRNLSSLIVTMAGMDAARCRAAAGRIFEPSDGQGVATRDLALMMGASLGRTPMLLPVPPVLLRAAGRAIGRADLVRGVVDRLETAPATELEAAFGWRPVEQMPESLAFLPQGFRPA